MMHQTIVVIAVVQISKLQKQGKEKVNNKNRNENK